MTRATLVFRYSVFAVLATLANLAAQRLVLAAVDGEIGFAMAVIAGTGAGLVLKYILDKRWIFDDRSTGLAAHGRKFTLYTIMGVVTTLVFWGFETAFWLIWRTDPMRELGAVIGLAIGYVIKYQLDLRFVFRTGMARPERRAQP
ncbi:GtrA family protein [Pikeienuella piscinae]|uniref:GtrA family protein n=1 Tax=Pikeienuella piscinae TaxID=2748098 RepID=A0A7L5BTZ8_9RHOB|nr:GtrA family protein [Pikeienuella piscinae]QIE54078.1 GtrA family protein [Pikeienuella piscinae]